MKNRNNDFGAVKKQAQVDLQKHLSHLKHFIPKHSPANISKFTKSYCKFKLSPSTSTYTDFLSDFFNVKPFPESHLLTYPYIILEDAHSVDLLLDATLTFLVSTKPSSVPLFVSAILSSIVPFDSTASVCAFLNKHIPNLSLVQQVVLFKWVRGVLVQGRFPFDLPSFQSGRSSVGMMTDCLKFMKTLAKTKRPLTSPFLSASLKIETIQQSGEIKGYLKIRLNKKVMPGSSATIEMVLSQNSTYLLGFIAYIEELTEIKMKSRPRIPVNLFIRWSEDAKVLPGATSMLSLVRKQAQRLNKMVIRELPRSLAQSSPELIQTTMNKEGDDYVWLNTVRPPTVTNGFLVFNKLVASTHKKPSKK